LGKSAGAEPYLAWYRKLDQLAESLGSSLGLASEPAFEEFLASSVQLLEQEMVAVGLAAEQAEELLTSFGSVARAARQKFIETNKVPPQPRSDLLA
jgi:hypothetical protein